MAINHQITRAKDAFAKAFPERQIYHRSGGSIRYVSISPWRQAMLAGVGTVVVGWCLFATASVLLRGPDGSGSPLSERKVARFERELKQARAGEAIALSLLEKRTGEFERHISEAEQRHGTLKLLLAHLQGNDAAQAVVMKGDDASVLVDATIEEADARQSRPAEFAEAANDVAGFRARFSGLLEQQTTFLDAAEDEAVSRAERARGVISLTGVQLSRVMDQPGVGGPLVEVANLPSATAQGEGDEFQNRVLEVAARLQEANLYEQLIHSLPLGAPMAVPYRETSGFGFRSDPFTRRTAWHDGADFGAYWGAPVQSTAPGKVSFAGVKSGYGRCVEIDHGLGFKTRYGHLNSITVKAGSEIALGQKVGTMGSTGRSTGPHLHYEVFFRGKAYDPIRFLRAGKHVHEG
jgi:murein DD-endopeptidase MepM/ murein hydrolase activator NlpD